MNFKLVIILLLGISLRAWGQAENTNTTADIFANWQQGEQKTYTVITDNFEIEGVDTTATIHSTYDVEITVKDKQDQAYVIEWRYKNIETTMPVPEIMDLMEDLKVVFKTEASGAFKEVVNWQEIQEFIGKALHRMKKKFKDTPFMEDAMAQMEATYGTREAIEQFAIQDIQQFHLFHGRKYTAGTPVTGKFQVPSLNGDTLLDAPFQAQLENFDPAADEVRLRMTKAVDRQQFTDAVFAYMAAMMQGIEDYLPPKEDFKDMKNETATAATLNGTGWLLSGTQTTTVTVLEHTNVETRVISLR